MNARKSTILRSLIVAGGLALGFCISACAEDDSFDNVSGCEEYVSNVSAAYEECGADPSDFLVGIDCSTYSEVTTCDVGDYWACLGAAYTCDSDTMQVDIDTTLLAECTSLATCS